MIINVKNTSDHVRIQYNCAEYVLQHGDGGWLGITVVQNVTINEVVVSFRTRTYNVPYR